MVRKKDVAEMGAGAIVVTIQEYIEVCDRLGVDPDDMVLIELPSPDFESLYNVILFLEIFEIIGELSGGRMDRTRGWYTSPIGERPLDSQTPLEYIGRYSNRVGELLFFVRGLRAGVMRGELEIEWVE